MKEEIKTEQQEDICAYCGEYKYENIDKHLEEFSKWAKEKSDKMRKIAEDIRLK